MKLKQVAIGLSAISLLAGATSALAIPTLSYTPTSTGVQVNLDPFGGFDWNSAGSAVTTTAPVFDGVTPFTTEFWADAVNVLDTGGTAFANTELAAAGVPGGAEFTIQALISETATPIGGNTVQFDAVAGGTFNIWYDATANANLVTGAGITDGTLILSGNILPGFAGTFTQTGGGTGGTGVFTFLTDVTFADPTFFNPNNFNGTNSTGTLQFGTNTTAWTQPTSRPGGAIDANALVLQADANSTMVLPVPGTLLLMGIGGVLGGLAASKRTAQS